MRKSEGGRGRQIQCSSIYVFVFSSLSRFLLLFSIKWCDLKAAAALCRWWIPRSSATGTLLVSFVVVKVSFSFTRIFANSMSKMSAAKLDSAKFRFCFGCCCCCRCWCLAKRWWIICLLTQVNLSCLLSLFLLLFSDDARLQFSCCSHLLTLWASEHLLSTPFTWHFFIYLLRAL